MYIYMYIYISIFLQKQFCRGVLKKRRSEDMQIHRRTPMPNCDFNKVATPLASFWCLYC